MAGLAAPGELPFLREMIALFAVSSMLAWLCQRLRIVPIVGFLVAGLLVGPSGIALVQDVTLVSSTAEIGVILLLFTIGTEFSLERLARIRRFILLGGGLQVGVTVAVSALVLMAFGTPWRTATFTGCLIALSSTAIVLKLLTDRRRTDTPGGRISIGILILQDLSIVLMVLMLPVLGTSGASGGEIARALIQALVIIGLVIELGRRLIPRLLDQVGLQKSQELFLLVVLTICFGIAWLLSLVGVSLALGAFLAGLAVSGSRFREHAIGDVLPLRTLFTAVFFASVGMLLDLSVVLDHPLIIFGVALGVAVLKIGLTAVAVLALRYPARLALSVGLGLAQIGEFSFVLEQAGRSEGLSPAGMGVLGQQVFLAVAVLLMAVTPFFADIEERLAEAVEEAEEDETRSAGAMPPPGASGRVIIGGFGMAGRAVAEACIADGTPYHVVDMNPVSVIEGQAKGVPIEFGDLSRRSVLEHAGLDEARCLVIAINDPEAVARTAMTARLLRPDLRIVARVRYAIDEAEVREAGADEVVVEEVEALQRLVTLVRQDRAAVVET